MCGRDGHIYYVSLLSLESQDLQNDLIEAFSIARKLSGFLLLIYFFVLVIFYSNADACKWAAFQMITDHSYY